MVRGEVGIDTSGDNSYGNTLAESVIGLFKTEIINLLGACKSMAQIKWQTLKWVHCFNIKHLRGIIGHTTPNETA